jgi:hypothetical protein
MDEDIKTKYLDFIDTAFMDYVDALLCVSKLYYGVNVLTKLEYQHFTQEQLEEFILYMIETMKPDAKAILDAAVTYEAKRQLKLMYLNSCLPTTGLTDEEKAWLADIDITPRKLCPCLIP